MRRTVGSAFPLVAALFAAVASGSATVAAADAPTLRIPIGNVRLDSDESDLEDKMGGAFSLGLESGVNNCYVEALSKNADQSGSIGFVVTPPPGEGHYLVALEPQGSLSAELVACVHRVF